MSCYEDQQCKNLFNVIRAESSRIDGETTTTTPESRQALQSTTISSETGLTLLVDLNSSYHTAVADYTLSALDPTNLCRCITLSYKCQLEEKLEKNEISNPVAKNIFLSLYLMLMFFSLAVNLVTFLLIISDHRKFFRKLVRRTYCYQRRPWVFNSYSGGNGGDVTNNPVKAKSSQISSLNSISDLLMFNLLLSNLIITVYVLPNQLHLFYFNTYLFGSSCRIGEFLKAFSVSLSIYSLVSISFQRLIVIKFTLFSFSPLKTRLFHMFHCFSVSSFFRSIGSISYTFFCSVSHRRYLITTILLILTWSISIMIGLFNSAHFTVEKLVLENFEFYRDHLGCQFEPGYNPVNYYCTTHLTNWSTSGHLFAMDDIIFLLLLLIIPNFVVLLSYSWVLVTIWSKSHRFDSFNLCMMAKNTIDQYEMKQNGGRKAQNETDSQPESEPFVGKSTPPMDRITRQSGISSGSVSIPRYNYQLTIKKRNIYITLSTFLMIFCFSLCWIPFFIFPVFYSKIDDTNLYNNIKVTVHLIGYSSVVFNPIILITKSKRFKPKMRSLLSKVSTSKGPTNY